MKILKMTCMLVFLVCFGQYTDALSVSMRFNVMFCIYEQIHKYILGILQLFLFVFPFFVLKFGAHVVFYYS